MRPANKVPFVLGVRVDTFYPPMANNAINARLRTVLNVYQFLLAIDAMLGMSLCRIVYAWCTPARWRIV